MASKKKKRGEDYRGIPTPVCPNCQSNWFRMTVMFDEIGYMPSAYALEDAECFRCGALIITFCILIANLANTEDGDDHEYQT